jgi:DNA-binding helix-hairpin-helix protein with protein kinase domain
VVQITNQELVAGRARVPIELIGEVTGYTGEEATLERGQRLDARAWLLIRGWVAPVVRVELADPTDPTPYWIVSTRRPNEVVAAIAKARAAV